MPAQPPAVDARLAKAMSHPLRARILATLQARTASPVELAEEFGEPLGHVSYHVKMLESWECIELVETQPRRGALEHFYRAAKPAPVADRVFNDLPATVRRALADGVLTQLAGDLAVASERGGFERSDVHLTRTPLAVDEQGWG